MKLKKYKKPTIIAVDTETTGLIWAKEDRPFGIGIAYESSKNTSSIYINRYYDFPVEHNSRNPNYANVDIIRTSWLEYYCNPKITKVFANAKFDMHMIEKAFGIRPRGPIIDVLVAAWCCNTQEPSYGLKRLASKYLDIGTDDERELREAVISGRVKAKKLGWKIATNSGDKIPPDYWIPKALDPKNNLCEKYCKLDCIRTLQLWEFYEDGLKELEAEETFQREMELMLVLYDMESRGVRFNETKCDKEKASLERAIAREEFFVKLETNRPSLNLASPKQVIDLLYKNSHPWTILITNVTETKLPSTDTPTLENFRSNKVVEAILKFRGYDTGRKYCNNYKTVCTKEKILTLKDMPWLERKSVHPGFNQINACTGRLSCSNPNLQNVSDPEKSNGLFVTDARAMFGPRPGYNWYCIDYKQLEARIFAEIAGEEEMIEAFNNPNVDPFTELGTQVYGTKFSEGKRRKITKNVFYCKIFCGGPKVLQRKYHVSPLGFAREVLDSLGRRFPGIAECQKRIENIGIKSGCITTLFGRQINIDPNFSYRAISYMVQGTAADLIKRAMIRCDDFLKTAQNKVDGHLLLSVHDELVFEIKQEHCFKWVLHHLQTLMEDNSDVLKINTPTEIERTSTNWSSKAKTKIKL